MAAHPHLSSMQTFCLVFLLLGVAILRIEFCFIIIENVCTGPRSSLTEQSNSNKCVFHSTPFASSSIDNPFFWLPWGCNKLPQSLAACTSIDYAHIRYGCKFRQGFKAGKHGDSSKAWDSTMQPEMLTGTYQVRTPLSEQGM